MTPRWPQGTGAPVDSLSDVSPRITSHRDLRWLFNPEADSWHALDEETKLPTCGTQLPPSVEIHDELPAGIVEAVRRTSVFATPLCAACARVAKLHRG